MSRLFICEKQTLAEHLLSALPKPHKKERYVYYSGDDAIVWSSGHILSAFMPEDYDPVKYKKWDLSNLPVFPDSWKLKVDDKKKALFNEIKSQIAKADEIVNVGDPDREGQFLVDEILHHLKVKNKKISRLFISQYNIAATQKALKAITDNKKYHNTYLAGLARQQMDWYIGMNLSRAYTVKARNQGYYGGTVRIGRVKMPTVNIVAKRDEEIENFVSKQFFELYGKFEIDGKEFIGRWKPAEISNELIQLKDRFDAGEELTEEELTQLENHQHPDWLDENYRIIDKAKADEIAKKIKNAKNIKVIKYEKKETKEYQPLGYNLSQLEKEIGRRTKLKSDDIRPVCQKLYEKDGIMTYPRSEYNHLTEDLYNDAEATLEAISAIPELREYVDKADLSIKSRIWNDSKVEAHHAIIPTVERPVFGKLSAVEQEVYRILAQRYLEQFYPEARYDDAVVEIEADGERFIARGRVTLDEGWKVVGNAFKKAGAKPEKEEESLPVLKNGDVLALNDLEVKECSTNPPKMIQLLELPIIMSKVHTLATDPAEVKMLKQLKGIGTEATRNEIIKELIKSGFLEIEKKGSVEYVHATQLGKTIVKAIPNQITDVGLTAKWETALSKLEKGQITFEEFDKKQKDFVVKMINQDVKFDNIKDLPSNNNYGGKTYPKKEPAKDSGKICPECGKPLLIRKSKNGEFLGCSGFPNCKHTAPILKTIGRKCPDCGGDLVEKIVTKEGANKGKKYIGCSNFPTCKYFEWPDQPKGKK